MYELAETIYHEIWAHIKGDLKGKVTKPGPVQEQYEEHKNYGRSGWGFDVNSTSQWPTDKGSAAENIEKELKMLIFKNEGQIRETPVDGIDDIVPKELRNK